MYIHKENKIIATLSELTQFDSHLITNSHVAKFVCTHMRERPLRCSCARVLPNTWKFRYKYIVWKYETSNKSISAVLHAHIYMQCACVRLKCNNRGCAARCALNRKHATIQRSAIKSLLTTIWAVVVLLQIIWICYVAFGGSFDEWKCI